MIKRKKKSQKEQLVTKNFVVTETHDNGISITTKNYDWKLELSPSTSFGQQMIYFVKNNTGEEVNELLTMVYYTSVTMIGNMELTKVVSGYFERQITDAKVVDDESKEKEDLEIVKKDLDGKKSE